MSGNVVVTGGTAAQQTTILQAHSQATAALLAAQTLAKSGGGGLSTWFGTPTAALQATVAAAYGAAATALVTWAIRYDLVDDVYDLMLAPDIVILFDAGQAAPAVAAGLWRGYWNWAAMNPDAAAAWLWLSVAHEAINLASANVIYDQMNAMDERAAQRLAICNPAAAPMSLRNYLYFALAGTALRSQLRIAPRLAMP